MHPSTAPAGPTAGQDVPQRSPGPGTDHSTAASREATGRGPWSALKRGGSARNSPMSSEYAHLMEEPPGGPNHGRRASSNPEVEGSHVPLGADDWQAAEFMREGGWSMVDTSRGTHHGGAREAGMTAHRGVLHGEDFVDAAALQEAVESGLGFTYAEVHGVYRQGPLSADKRELRARIDARMLALSRAGGSMAALGRALGFPIKEDGHCRAIENALARARDKETA